MNPDHLEPVPPFVNWQRGRSPHALDAQKTHCAQGHEFTPENTRVYSYRNQRVCLICKRAAGRETQRRVPKEQRAAYMREYRSRKQTDYAGEPTRSAPGGIGSSGNGNVP